MTATPARVKTADVAAFLHARFGPDVADVASIGRGEWSRAFSFRRGDRHYVARFGAYRDDFAKDRLAARYALPDLPIPAVIEIGEALGAHYAVSERAFGQYIDDLDGTALRAALPSLFAAFDAAHRVDLTSTAGFGMWNADGIAPHPTWRAFLLDVAADRPGDRIHGWRARLEGSPTGAEPFDAAMRLLCELVDACPDERHLIHSDLLHFNVLVADARLTAVVDWGNALYGDFLYDPAWFDFWSPWQPAWTGVDFREETARRLAAYGLDPPNVDERFRCCLIHIGLDGQKYNAYTGNWRELAAIAKRTLAVARGEL